MCTMATGAKPPALTTTDVDTVVVGGGQAGLAVSRLLSKQGITHVVLERGSVGNSWRTQRWESFHLNTPNSVNVLPDDDYEGNEPGGFGTGAELVAYLDGYRRRYDLPVVEKTVVTAIRSVDGGYEVEASDGLRRCRNVVLCTGDQNHPRIPRIAESVPDDIVQMHTADYRRPDQLPDGATLVVGSGQSGVQIVEDLLEADRRVYLCTSAVGRFPRRYRGRDVFDWMLLTGMAEHRPEDLEDPNEVNARLGQVSGTRGGHSVSLHQLGREGAHLLGRLEGVTGRTLQIGSDLESNAVLGDRASAKIRAAVDTFINATGVEAPPARPDPADEPFSGLADMSRIREVNLDEADIASVVWATGFGPDFSYLDSDLLDKNGCPRHDEGVCRAPGMFCLGLWWLRRRISGTVPGIAADAEYVVSQILARRKA